MGKLTRIQVSLAKYDNRDLRVLGIGFVIPFAKFVKKLLNSFAIFPGSYIREPSLFMR